MKKIAVSGGIGSGKSTVCKVFEQLGFPVFYSDVEAKLLMVNNTDVIHQIIDLLGEEAYLNGELNKKFVADKIFNDVDLKERMNAIVHPAVRKAFNDWTLLQKSTFVLNEAAILFETGAYKNFDKTILITSPEELKIKRIRLRDNCSLKEAQLRIKNQWSDEQKIPLADYVIVNDEKISIIQQVLEIIAEIESI